MTDDYTIPDAATMPGRPSEWMKHQLAGALCQPIAQDALLASAQGKGNITATISLSRDNSEVEDYTCDRCRTHHPDGLNVAITAFGQNSDLAQTTIKNPMDLFEWAAVVVQVGLCHTCWTDEGYPASVLSDLDPGFVQQAVRLMDGPDVATITDWTTP